MKQHSVQLKYDYPCSQFILPTPVATFLFLDPFSQLQFPALVPNFFVSPCSQSLFLNSAPYPCSLLLFLILFSILVILLQSLFPAPVFNPCSLFLVPLLFFPMNVANPCCQPFSTSHVSSLCSLFPFPTPVFNSCFQLLLSISVSNPFQSIPKPCS